MKKILSICLCLLALASNAQVNTPKLDSLFNQLQKYNKVMGSVAITKDGKVDYNKTIGYVNTETQMLANNQTLYHIGSVSKMFTAVMILQLIEEKKLDLSTPLITYFPTLPNAAKITMAQLLNHTSGLHSFTSDPSYLTYLEKPQTEKDLVAIWEKFEPDFEPGAQYEYSNTAYVVLSFIIEKITQQSYNEALQNRICNKIGLKQTRIAEKINTRENIAQSYSMEYNVWTKETETDASIPKGAGAIISTPTELCTFIDALFNNKLLNENSFKEMTKIGADKNGKGIFEFPFGTKKVLGHTGAIDGFKSSLGYFPEDKIAFCVMGNAIDYPLNDVVLGMLKIYFNKPYEIPSFERKPLTAEALKTIKGKYRNDKISMSITIFEEKGKILAQADGQSAFPLDKVSETEYKFDTAGIKLMFNKNDNGNIPSLILEQSGGKMTFDKIE